MLGHGHGSEFFYEDAIKSTGSGGYGRASLDSSRRPSDPVLPRRPSSGSGGGRARGQVKVTNSESHILATSTPFRRSYEGGGGGIGVDDRPRTLSSDTTTTSPGSPTFTRGGRSETGDSAVSPSSPLGRRVEDDHRSMSPKSKAAGGLRPVFSAPFRSRKRSMSVQEPHQSVRNLLGKRQDGGGVLQHHRLNGGSRSNSSLGGRLSSRGGRERHVSEDGDEPRRTPQHDWLGPRSVKALRAAGLLNDDRDRDMDTREQDKYVLTTTTVTRNSRERSGSVATSVVSGGSGSGKASLSGLGRFMPSAAARSCSASEYSPQNGRAQSRMAFSDVGGSGPGRRESGTFSHQYLMHSPTLTISTASGSRDRDTPRSAASTAPTSVSSTSLAYRERERERDEIRDLKEKHATETGALLGALSDSQRTTRMLREENIDLRERLERMRDSEGENEELRREVRGLRREVNELKIQLLTASGGRGSRNGWLSAGRRSGVTTPVSEEREWLPPRSSMSDTDVTEVLPPKVKDVFRPQSVWSRQEAPPLSPSPPSLFSAPDTPASPETPRRHRRCPSDTSSIFPVLPSNMSMLMHEENGLLGDQGSSHDGSSTAFDSAYREDSSASTVITATKNGTDSDAGSSSSKPVPFRMSAAHNNGITSSTPVANRGGARTSVTPTSVSISPTTVNFSIMTGSPGSLFLRPEHEVHLGDMETFSLDFGSRMDEVGDLVEDW